MATIKLVGGAKKLFSTDQLELDIEGITLEKLLELLLEIKPKDTGTLDDKHHSCNSWRLKQKNYD
jgi:hypothetical protein